MIILKLNPFELSPDDTHLSTEWQVTTADDPNFENPFVDTGEDTEHLYILLVDKQMELGQEYIARARTISDIAGLSNWSNVPIAHTDEANDDWFNTKEPRRIMPPQFYFDEPYENNEVPFTNFYVRLKEVFQNSEEKIKSVSWLIQDLDENVVLFRPNDEDNLSYLYVDIILDENSIYKITAQYHMWNGDASVASSAFIYTPRSKLTKYVPKYYPDSTDTSTANGTYNTEDKIRIEIEKASNATGSIIEIIRDDVVVETIEDSDVYEITNPEYDARGFVTVRAKSKLATNNEEWIYWLFIKQKDGGSELPVTLPTELN